MVRDDFRGGAPDSGGTTTGGVAGGAGRAATSEDCDAGVGVGGRCGTAGGNLSIDAQPAPTPDASEDSCPGSRGPNGVCYVAEPRVSSWSDARASCRQQGADWDLATLRSTAESDFVWALTGYEVWIGATDEADEGVWMWVGDDAPFFDVEAADAGVAFPPWNAGEPNNQDDSDCLRMLATGLWADWQCDDQKGHVCQETVR
jgi:hypothetical protein